MISILTKLQKIQSDLKAPKNQYNSFGKYKYRNCEDILEALKPLLNLHGCALTINDKVEKVDDRYYIVAKSTLFCIETGEHITTEGLARESKDKKGMDDSQITGSTSSYARKYSLNGLFLIDDTKDADSGTNDSKKSTPKATNDTVKKGLSDKQVGRLWAIAKAKGVTEENVKRALQKLYQVEDVKDLSVDDYNELCSRIEDKK